jgi:HSP20 family protein
VEETIAMARSNNQNDDLLMEDELAAAFLDGDEATLVEEELGLSPEPSEELPSEEGNDGWDTETEDFPGQLAVDVYETTDKLIVKGRTAGINRQDLDVSISDNILTISGTLNGGEDENATQWHIQECYWGEFSRTIALPVQVKEEGVSAVLKDGVLTISFEKEKAASPKKISIN